jgi:hypothetical protein
MAACRLAPLLLAALLAGAAGASPGERGGALRFLAPDGLLTDAETVRFVLRVPPRAKTPEISVLLDGSPLPRSSWSRTRPNRLEGTVESLAEGPHELAARVDPARSRHGRHTLTARDRFEVWRPPRPDVCDVLTPSAGPPDPLCVFPWPSSRYLVPADTETGVRVALPEEAMPLVSVQDPLNFLFGLRFPLDPSAINGHDGFSPTVQILMHFPGGVDLEASGAPRLLPTTRTFDLRSLERSSPTVLIDADTREWIPHFVENDVRAGGAFASRQATILRPGRSLLPGHRYIVAVRDLRHPDGSPLEAEPGFAALRDGRPTDVAALLERRAHFEDLFRRLRRAGVPRHDLVLAFDFVVQSDAQLTSEMLSMREQAFAFLAAHRGGADTFTVDEVRERNPGCADPSRPIWKEVRGTFQVPLFLDADPYAQPGRLGFLRTDAAGRPFATATARAPYGLAIPCAALERPLPGLVLGHGLFGNGPDTVSGLTNAAGLSGFEYVAAGTNWSGLSSLDVGRLPSGPDDIQGIVRFLTQTFIGQIFLDFSDFPALPDRLRQGQLATLVLARMLATGAFHAHPEFRTPGGRGVLDTDETFYFGASLGGIMGLMFAALTPDVRRLNVDVPSINFSILLQRATPFLAFEQFLQAIESDPNVHLLTIGLLHETWVRGESAGYATHITHDPLPGTHAKNVLMTVALYDQQVSNIGSEIAGATLSLPNLEGSAMPELPLLPSREGPLESAYVVYDAGSFDAANPLHAPFIPPLANRQAQPNRCDPHARRGFIPASVEQLLGFLRPGGTIENFCTDDGLCNASEPFEIPFGDEAPCDPLGP